MSGLWAVTGSSGFLGAELCRRLVSHGKSVLRLQRTRAEEGWLRFTLGEPLPQGALAGVEVLVHCAHDFRPRSAEAIERVNVQGSFRLLEAAREARVPRIVFVSSVSAYTGCVSLYGRAKLRVEARVAELGGCVLRPGVIYADTPGGFAGRLEKLSAWPLLPVFSGGRQPLYLVHRDDVVSGIERAAEREAPPEPLLVAHPVSVPFREVLSLFARRHGRRVRFVSVPADVALLALRALERVGLGAGFSSDSLLGLLHPNPDPKVGDLFGVTPRSFAEWAHSAPVSS